MTIVIDPTLFGPDGETFIYRDGDGWDDFTKREATEDEGVAAVVVGVKKSGIVELLELVPKAPEGTPPCSHCNGNRWWFIEGTSHSFICHVCMGRGWCKS